MRKVEEDVSPNLIPMIDIMFLLLLFFMLGADMGQRELEPVRLPGADVAEKDPGGERLTLNVTHGPPSCADYGAARTCREDRHWSLRVRGVELEGAALAARLKAESPDRPVMIRADAASPYGFAQKAMLACAQAGLRKISVGAGIR